MAIATTHPLPSGTRFGPEAPSLADHQNVSDLERIGSLVAGVLLLGYGLTRRSVPCTALGGYLTYRAQSGRCRLYEALGVHSRTDTDGFPTTFTRSMTVNRPRKEVYEFFLSNSPVGEELDLAGAWEDELLFWSSPKGIRLETQYAIELEEAPLHGATVVRAWVSYVAPHGGGALSVLVKPFTARRVERDLREVKQLLECGEIATTVGQPSGASLRRWLTNPLWRTS
ncbi:MAG TPA: YgaP-like transmembrane domain [Vicinamibacteria bacterium]|nr:YgaP-like transmembrane domain [Vicinamibacteria bacterium]